MSKQLAFSALISAFLMLGFVVSGIGLPHEGAGVYDAITVTDMNASYDDVIHLPDLTLPVLN